MISSKTLLYIGHSRGVHDDRFIKALNSNFKVTTLFRCDNNPHNSFIAQKYDLIVVSPISIGLLEYSRAFVGPKIGICWAIEINNVLYGEKEITLIQNILKNFRAIIVDADYIEDLIRKKFKFNGSILKLYFGCDINLFFRAKNFREEKKQTRVCVTRNSLPIYNNGIIIEALSRVNNPEVIEVIFTSEKEKLSDYHKSIVDSSKIKFTFMGKQSEDKLATVYHNSDVYVSAALSDGISVSLLEAMASGLICVVTDFPTNLEIIQHSLNGFIFKNGDINSLIDVLEQVFRLSKEDRFLIVSKAQEFVLKFANWEKNSLPIVNQLSKINYAD